MCYKSFKTLIKHLILILGGYFIFRVHPKLSLGAGALHLELQLITFLQMDPLRWSYKPSSFSAY